MINGITLKRDPVLLGFAALVFIGVVALIMHGDISWKIGAAFLLSTFMLPGLFGKADEPDPPPPPPPPTSPPSPPTDVPNGL